MGHRINERNIVNSTLDVAPKKRSKNLTSYEIETVAMILAKVYDAMEEYAKQREIYKNGWIDANEEQPLLVENEDYSPNVLAICNGQLMVMCYCYNPSEDDAERGFFWANCNGQIDGDAEFDDEYDVAFWQYLPSIEGFVA